MATVRRLYLYAMSGITLAVLATGLQILLDILLNQVGIGRGEFVSGFVDADRQQLSVAAALVGVGLPVWAIHWFLVGRALRPGRDGTEAERGSPIRAFYLALVLAVAAFSVAAALRDLLGSVLRMVINVQVPDWYGSVGNDPSGAAALLAIGGLVWAYHATVRRADVAVGPLFGAAAWWPRVYLYGASLVGLLIAAEAVGTLISIATASSIDVNKFGDVHSFGELAPGDARLVQLVDKGAELVAWGAFWMVHWWLAARSMADTGWRGPSERQARLRLAYLVGVTVIGVARAVQLVGAGLGAGIPLLLGARDAVGTSGRGDLAQAILVPLASAVPWGLAWWFHHRRMRAEAVGPVPGAAGAATTARLDLHGVSTVGLAFGAVGLGWLFGLAIDVVLGGDRTIGDAWKFEVGTYLPFALLGFTLWAWTWARLRIRRAGDPAAEARSTTRRVALLIVFGAALVTSIGSLALVLYRLFATALGVLLPGNPVSELSTPIGALATAVVVAVYHGLTVRTDTAIAKAAVDAGVPDAPGTAPSVSRILVLRGPASGDPTAAIAALRGALPPGFDLDDRSS